jgi:hypothetical protein
MTPKRQKTYESVKAWVNTPEFNKSYFNSACHVRKYPLGMVFDEDDHLESWACHYDLGTELTVTSHKKHFIVNNLFHNSISNDTALKLIDIYKKTMFSTENSSFKDVSGLFTLVVNDTQPHKSVFFYFNDLDRDLTPFERAQCFNFFLMSRIFTEHYECVEGFLDLIDNGFSFEEAAVFGHYINSNSTLPYYNTHWALNGPSIGECARWVFRLGPNPDKNYKNSGLYVNSDLWAMNGIPTLWFDGSGKVKDEPVLGVFGRYSINKSRLEYDPVSNTVTRIQSLRSFLDNYRKEYIKP